MNIAFFVNSIEFPYYSDILSGIRAVIQQAGANLDLYVGGTLTYSDRMSSGENSIYSLANPGNTDGLIFLGDLSREISMEEFRNFCNRFSPIPSTAIAFPLDQGSYVEVDYKSGIKELLDHLIVHHGYRRIACITGPSDNYEADLRLQAYREVLNEHGIAYDPLLVVPGDFNYLSGRQAIEILLDEPKVEFDAVFALSDGMAAAACEMLNLRGYSVPKDVALVSFNDSTDLLYHSPSMTTIDQNLELQGRMAARRVLDLIEGKQLNNREVIPTSLVIRESCGCHFEITGMQSIFPKKKVRISLLDFAGSLKEKLSADSSHYRDIPAEHRSEVNDLVDAFFLDAQSDLVEHRFVRKFRTAIVASSAGEVQMEFWQKFVMLIHKEFHSHVIYNEAVFTRFDELVHRAIRLISRNMLKRYTAREHEFKTVLLQIKYFSQFINSSTNLAMLNSHILRHLPDFGITRCAVALYASGIHNLDMDANLPDQVKIILAYDERGEISLSPEQSLVNTMEFTPSRIFDKQTAGTQVLFSLFFRKEHYGFIVLEYGSRVMPGVYSTVPGLISGALNIVFTLNNLHTARQQIMQTSQMAALGELTSGISHELRNPLNAITNFAMLDRESLEELEDILTSMNSSNDPGKSERVTKILRALQSSSNSIYNQSSHAIAIISGILKQARGEKGIIEQCDINAMLEEELHLADHSYRSKYPDFSFSIFSQLFANLPLYRGNSSQLNRAFMNFISNALDAMRYKAETDPSYSAELKIQTEYQNHQTIITIEDNGVGISTENRSKIFTPFFSTKPSDQGTGLGLRMSQEIIVEGHNGEILCESEPGSFTRFTIIL
ncbi:substrate-binding domain-containing protein [Spirochaeta dissipatitropha]